MCPYQLTILIPWLVLISMPLAANSPMVSTFRSKCKTRHATISDNQAKNLQIPIHPIQIVYTLYCFLEAFISIKYFYLHDLAAILEQSHEFTLL